ncbi:MAG: FAD-dependent thymidylate synthase [Acidobacteriota bacterium]
MRDPKEQEALARFVSDPAGNVFVVNPGALPGMIGAVYARYSRAKGGFREILLNEFVKEGILDPKRADELIERVLIQFGDDSVQELESAWLSIEEISNIATKAIEDRRLGSYIEQSSRYVYYDRRDDQGRFRYLREPTIMASPHAAAFEATMNSAFETYCRLIAPMQAYFERRKPLESAEYEIRLGQGRIRYDGCGDERERRDFHRTWVADIRTKTCDTLRILLPVATLTNVGMHANGRTFEHMLRHLYSSDLPELQEIAKRAHTALNTIIPRYVQRAQRTDFLVETRHAMCALAEKLLAGLDAPLPAGNGVRLIRSGSHDDGQLAAMLFAFSELPFETLLTRVEQLSGEERHEILETYVGRRTWRRDRPGRALEFGCPWLFELVIDFGIYRDLHRHRMVTQERQLLSTRLGFAEIPPEIVEAGFSDDIQTRVDASARMYERIRADLGREIAQYAVLFGFNVRCYFGFNDREAQHLLELRTGRQGHRSYRRVCQEMYRQMLAVAPERVRAICQFVDLNDYEWPRADSEAWQRAMEAGLGS